MYKIESVKIENFWQRFAAETTFNSDVNIIIGKNGTGKTTFMNILHSVLSVDVNQLNNADFESIEIKLKDGKKRKTIKARLIENDLSPLLTIEYQISSKKYKVRILSSDDRRYAPHYRRRAIEESEEVRGVLSSLVSLSSLSVYRLRSGEDYEVRDNRGTRTITPVDFRLNQLLQNLTMYQLELSQEARDIATDLQKEVLASILYSQDDMSQVGYELNYDKKQEKTNLVSAYQQLNAMDSKVRRKISFHVDSIDNTISSIKEKDLNVDFRSLEALRNTRKIIKMSLDAEKKTSKVYEPISLFLSILCEFITDKKFEFNSGSLHVHNGYDDISYNSLSSGEKQLLILFIETLLQRNKPYVFLTDEPELSLHISWQRKIIPAIKRLNPCAQVIAATHSPEVASKYRHSIFDMEKLVNG
ncbi:TPA: AAA family ATPase [Photobacterium damselae]